MSVFGDYARYYDVLYQDKDYAGEVAFVLECLGDAGCTPSTLLDLGCGTGLHALEMAKRSICVTGVDMSETMLAMGRKMLSSLDISPRINLTQGDVRTVRLGETFDAVTSLFHVMSYQNTEVDALAMLETAKVHLNPGGLFLFDFWYGAGVLTDPPTKRKKTLADKHISLTRYAVPEHRVAENIVSVDYEIFLTNHESQATTTMREKHVMRYWFLPELCYLASQNGFCLCAAGEWMSGYPLNISTWNGYVCLRFE